MELAKFNLSKTDTLQGQFRKSAKNRRVEMYSQFTIDLSTVEFPPHAVGDAATTPEDTAVDVNVVGNDTDLEDAALSVSAITQPPHGSAILKSGSSAVITYTPSENFHGRDSFSYTVSDGALTADAAVTVTVHPVNDAPTVGGSSGVDYAENGISDAAAYSVADPDTGDSHTWSLAGTDAEDFDLSGGGVLSFKDPPDYEVKSSYWVTVAATDASGASGSIAVTITVLNVDEAGTVVLDPTTPQVGSELTATLSDPDGGVTDVTWAWESSTDRTTWSAIAGAGQAAYTPTDGDAGKYLRAKARYADGHGSGKIARANTAAPVPVNQPPAFPADAAGRSITENATVGSRVGNPVTATDGDGDALTYALTGSRDFAIDNAGQITVASGATLDYESAASYSVTVTVHDGKDADGAADTSIDVSMAVAITIANVDEAGTVALDPGPSQVGSELTATLAAMLFDPDGDVTGVTWLWESSANGSEWAAVKGATAAAYTTSGDDAGKYLRATARYTDGFGPGMSARATTANPISRAFRHRTNPTAPNNLIQHLSGNFVDTDGDGMTDVAEIRYGFDPRNAASFPVEPVAELPERHPIEDSEIGAYYEVNPAGLDIKWTNPKSGKYSLRLKTAGSNTWNIYYGGHGSASASVELAEFNLSKTDTLQGAFTKYAKDGSFVERYSKFTIDLSTVDFPAPPIVGDPSNRLAYTFSADFPPKAEAQYREFLKRVFPLLYAYLGPPAEDFNVHIDSAGDGSTFTTFDHGRTLTTDADFVPRLIAHEFIHAWKGKYAINGDDNWEHDDALTGFEEATAEGMALEIMHEYVRSYPNDPATLQLLRWRPYQYWSLKTTHYDSIKNLRATGSGAFFIHAGGSTTRYSIAATTVQMMVRQNPNFMREFMSRYYQTIRQQPDWRPNRKDMVEMWATAVPRLNGHPLKDYLDTLPVFNGRKLDQGLYVLGSIRPYGYTGDQQFALAYAIPDGRLWWDIPKDDGLDDVPQWLPTFLDENDDYYTDTQNSRFTVEVADAYGREYATYNYKTRWDRWSDGSPKGFGWKRTKELDLENFPLGLYKETVTFTDYIQHDEGAREHYYFFGLKGFQQDKHTEYVIMVGVDGASGGTASIRIQGKTHSATIRNGAAVFRSKAWPFDMQGEFSIVVTNAEKVSRTYHRTLIEAGTYHNVFQHQFIIVDTDFNGVEDQFE